MNILQSYLLRAYLLRATVFGLGLAVLTSCATANQPPAPVEETVSSTPTGIVEHLATPVIEPTLEPATETVGAPIAVETPTAIEVTPAPDEEWVTESYGDAWTISYPAGWSVDDAGAYAGSLRVAGSYEGRSYAVTYSYPIGLLAESLEAWVDEALLPLTLEQRNNLTILDITVDNAPAKKVLNLPTMDGASVAYQVYIWRTDSKNPRMVIIEPTDGQPLDEVAMDRLLDRLLAAVQ